MAKSKAKADEEVARAEASKEYAHCALRFARTPVGHYRERQEAKVCLARAEREMVKAFGRQDAEVRMTALCVEAIRSAREAGA